MSILYKCSAKGCSKILEQQGLCDIHQAKADKANKIRYKVYRTDRLMDKEQKKYQSFYNSGSWIRSRLNLIANCYAIDIVELYRTGKVKQGNPVHHIIELSEDYSLRLDTNNMIYVTDSNHQFIHKEYNKGDREKKAMQRVLNGLKTKFKNDYGI